MTTIPVAVRVTVPVAMTTAQLYLNFPSLLLSGFFGRLTFRFISSDDGCRGWYQALVERVYEMTSLPALTPLVLPASNVWMGNDGNWSTFEIEVGTPPQAFHVLPSTDAQFIAVPVSEGCIASDPPNCGELRGVSQLRGPSTGFQYNESSTWEIDDIYTLLISKNLTTQNNNALFGNDTLTLPSTTNNETDQTTVLPGALIAGVATKDFYLGLLGLSGAPASFNNRGSTSRDSLLSALRAAGHIPSLSWAYTAGASYRASAAQLILGGYDIAQRPESDSDVLTVPFYAAGGPAELVVSIQAVLGHNTLLGVQSFLDAGSIGLYATIDSSLPFLWLPSRVCNALQQAFDLELDSRSGLYLISDEVHARLLEAGPSLTFRLGGSLPGSDDDGSPLTVDIELPYAALYMWAEHPLFNSSTRYFAVRRAANDSQISLGRALLQEAYLVADYERRTLALSQRVFADGPSNITAIEPYIAPSSPDDGNDGSGSGATLSPGAIAGIAIGAFLFPLGIALLGVWLWRRRAIRIQNRGKEGLSQSSPQGRSEADGKVKLAEAPYFAEKNFYPGEMVGDSKQPRELEASAAAAEKDGKGLVVVDGVWEMEGEGEVGSSLPASVSRYSQTAEDVSRMDSPADGRESTLGDKLNTGQVSPMTPQWRDSKGRDSTGEGPT